MTNCAKCKEVKRLLGADLHIYGRSEYGRYSLCPECRDLLVEWMKLHIVKTYATSGVETPSPEKFCGVEVATDEKTGKPDYCPLPKGHAGAHMLDLSR